MPGPAGADPLALADTAAPRNGGLVYRPVGARGEPYPAWLRQLSGESGVYVIRQGGEVVYPLTGVAKCGVCGGAIGCALAMRQGSRVKAYACTWHHHRGGAVCPVTVYQPMDEVEAALIDHLQEALLDGPAAEAVVEAIKREVTKHMPAPSTDVAELQAELRVVQAEQARLAQAIALADDVPALVAELDHRSARIRQLKAQIELAAKEPEEIAGVMARVEASARAQLADLRAALVDRKDLRDVFLRLFPGGLVFHPADARDHTGPRRVWRVSGAARIGVSPQCIATRVPPPAARSIKGSSSVGGVSSHEVATPTGFEPVLPT